MHGLADNTDWSMVMEVEVEDPTNNGSSVSSTPTDGGGKADPSKATAQYHENSIQCGPLKCLNGARCLRSVIPISSDKCLCPIGFSGETCHIATDGFRFPKIEDGGYVKFYYPVEYYTSEKAKKTLREIAAEFEIKPSSLIGNRLLMYHLHPVTGTKMMLSLEDGQVVYRIFRNSWLGSENQSSNMVELRHSYPLQSVQTEWFHMAFGHTERGTLYISVNGKRQELTTVQLKDMFDRFTHTAHVPPGELYFGGHPAMAQLTQDAQIGKFVQRNYVGCIQHIRVQGLRLDPRRKSFVGDAIEGFGIGEFVR
ncbi:unnamed protein product [Echinostoma caproni]|uniref:EGF-like domain-containing protein n=1 Tax=Echinostoma caproni TaxID=27848 RepID=A0A183AN06_9TREM|nr:unnamed protein product [Echinostoma caproni]